MKQEVLDKLKRLRGTRKPREVAEYLGIDESTYNKMENGTSNTWGDYLPKLLKYHKTNLTDFFEDIEGDTFIHQDIKEMKDSTAVANAKTFNHGVTEKTLEKIVESLKASLISEREMKEIYINKYNRCKEKFIQSELECKSLKEELKSKKI